MSVPININIQPAIENVLKSQIEEEVKIAIANAKYQLDKRIPEIVAGLSIRVMNRISMESLRDEIVIHVRMDK
jgi:hypothetical protein